ncbi:hypothetical protein DFJ74DRAFT_57343 [Hyaloraphidium curvatum]|nr:hypothetical protein DFJ74DRAFT_57343 [Hyaloraphidium curvatum]
MTRLRQIALIARDLEPALAALHHALGFELAFRDPSIDGFGLVNGVMTAGPDFVEVVAPMPGKNDTTGARWLARNGGEATGYMLLFHCKDAKADLAHMQANGVKLAWTGAVERQYAGYHLHPSSIPGGVLPSIDWMAGVSEPDKEPLAGWAYAHLPPFPPKEEPGWVGLAKKTGENVKIVGVTLGLTKHEPFEAAKRWSLLFRVPLETNQGAPAVRFSNAVVRFAPSKDGRDGIQTIDLLVPSVEQALDRASAVGAPLVRGGAQVAGVIWKFVEEKDVDVSREGGWIGKGGLAAKL